MKLWKMEALQLEIETIKLKLELVPQKLKISSPFKYFQQFKQNSKSK